MTGNHDRERAADAALDARVAREQQRIATARKTAGAARPVGRCVDVEKLAETPQGHGDARARRRAAWREREEQERAKRAAAALADVRERTPFYLGRCGVPPALCAADFEAGADVPPDLVRHVRTWADRPEGFLVLIGRCGVGKSYLAAAALAHVLRAGAIPPAKCLFLTEADFFESIRLEYGNVERDGRPDHIDFLVYDDLLSGYLNDIRRAELETALRRRYAAGLPAVLTSNADLQEIVERLGGRVGSVLAGDGQVLQFPIRDLRRHGTIRPHRPPRPGADA